MLSSDLLEILVCPLCKSKLTYDEADSVLICENDRLRYPIEDDIPIMLPERAEKY